MGPVTRQASRTAARSTTVLDIEKLRLVQPGRFPNAVLTCDVLVIGGGLGGVAAAEAAALERKSVILTEPTSRLGGQLTAQAVSCPDENTYIERNPGVGTPLYRQLRDELRAHYRALPGVKPGREVNIGSCWVSRISGEPAAWEAVIRRRLDRLRGPAGIREILKRNQLIRVSRFPHSGRYHYADFINLDTGRYTRVAAQFMLDATETGDGVAQAGLPFRIGAEARSEFGEPHAPETARPEWVQSFTYCFLVRWTPDHGGKTVARPEAYDELKALGEYTLGYDYVDRGRVFYKVFARVPQSGGPFWTYRRLIAAANFQGNPDYQQDLALINWRGNDYHEANFIGQPVERQLAVLRRAKAFAQGFLYWLQTECPRDEGGVGYPEMQLDVAAMGTEDGFAAHPYVRESRRIVSEFTLTENHLAPDPARPDRLWGEEFPDSIGIALYAMDIHPAQGEPPFLSRALPYHLPLGSFLNAGGAANILPAAKNFGATRLALSSARMHPTEWLAGEVAGRLAAFCLERGVEPERVRAEPSLLREFQSGLEAAGHVLRWSNVLGTAAPLPSDE